MNKGILIKTTTGMGGCDSRKIPVLSTVHRLHYRPSRLRQEKNAAIQRTGLYFERGKPNESLGLGSTGQLAGGNEMKQSGGKKTGWQSGDVTSGLN